MNFKFTSGPEIHSNAVPIEMHGDYDIVKFNYFRHEYHRWIHSGKQHVDGLPKDFYVVAGITDAFNQTYALYNTIGIFPGEYGYHKNVMPNRVTHDLSKADVIVISHPFSADGECSHHRIAEADKHNIPIVVDCAFFGACSGIDFDFKKYKNIHSVCFSLSKAFGTGLQRVGLLYTKDKYPVTIYDQWQYPLTASAIFHYKLIKDYGPDYIYDKYRESQVHVCQSLKLNPSSTVLFGVDFNNRYGDKYKRGDTNRVCISDYFSYK